MAILLAILVFSPVVVALMTAVILLFLSRTRVLSGLGFLWTMAFGFGIAAAAMSFAGTMAWVEWYETTKKYSAGNAIVGWIFFLAPMSFAIGQLAAFVLWLFKYKRIRK